MRRFVWIVFLTLAACALVGCGSSGPKEPGSVIEKELDGAPDWVLEGSGGSDDRIYGLGSVAGTRNVTLARSTAMARGRTEIARSLQVNVQSMLKDYQSTTTGGEYFARQAADEQYIEDVSKQITDMTLSGTRQEELWTSDTGTLYVLMSLDVEQFKNAIQDMENLSEEVREAVNERADKAFRDLDQHLR